MYIDKIIKFLQNELNNLYNWKTGDVTTGISVLPGLTHEKLEIKMTSCFCEVSGIRLDIKDEYYRECFSSLMTRIYDEKRNKKTLNNHKKICEKLNLL